MVILKQKLYVGCSCRPEKIIIKINSLIDESLYFSNKFFLFFYTYKHNLFITTIKIFPFLIVYLVYSFY